MDFLLRSFWLLMLLNGLEGRDMWTPLDWATLPKALPGDTVTVWYLVAPLLEMDVGNLLAGLQLYHGGVGFMNMRTNFTINVNYDAEDFFRASLFPQVVLYSNDTKDLQWLNQGTLTLSLRDQLRKGAAYIYEGIYNPYWCTLHEIVGEVNGTVYNRFISEWLSKVNKTHQFYNLFTVQEKWDSKPWIASWTCFDFVWTAFDVLHSFGAQFQYSHLERDFSNLYASKPPLKVTDLFYSQPEVRSAIIEFYETVQFRLGDLSFWELFWNLLDLFDGEFYIRDSTDYWKLDLQYPFVGLDWWEAPLPSSVNAISAPSFNSTCDLYKRTKSN